MQRITGLQSSKGDFTVVGNLIKGSFPSCLQEDLDQEKIHLKEFLGVLRLSTQCKGI